MQILFKEIIRSNIKKTIKYYRKPIYHYRIDYALSNNVAISNDQYSVHFNEPFYCTKIGQIIEYIAITNIPSNWDNFNVTIM